MRRRALLAAGTLAAAAALWLAAAGLIRLDAARTAQARLADELARPPLTIAALLPRAAILAAPDATAAARAAATRIAAFARDAGLLVERAVPERGSPGLAVIAVALSGSEDQLRRFIAATEAAQPVMRFGKGWRMEALAGGGARLAGSLAVAWARSPATAPLPAAPVPLARPAALDGVGALFAVEPAEEAPDAATPVLLGVVGRLGRDAVALVRGHDGRTQSLAIGAGVDGWTLRALSADAALFTRGGERLRVPLPAAEAQDLPQ